MYVGTVYCGMILRPGLVSFSVVYCRITLQYSFCYCNSSVI